MCILFTTDTFETKDTLLIVAPLRTPPSQPQAWQLTYINSIQRKLQTSYRNAIPSLNPGADPAPLMVVPIPNPHNRPELDFTLFEVSRTNASVLRLAADFLASTYYLDPPSEPQSVVFKGGAFGGGPTAAPPLHVQQIGSYRVSVAPSLQDLRTRAPWTRFSVSADTATTIVNDLSARYADSKTAFVIAEGSTAEGISSAGFSVRYRSTELNPAFFPTSHEPPAIISSSIYRVQLDVKLVALGAIIRPLSLLEPADHAPLAVHRIQAAPSPRSELWRPAPGVVLRADDLMWPVHDRKWHNIANIIHSLPMRGAGELHDKTFVEHEPVRIASLWKLSGFYLNRDVLARKATSDDVAVTEHTFTDLGAWFRHRMAMSKNSNTTFFSAGSEAFGLASVRLAKVDFVLSLLGRQLSDPGLNDRISDVPNKYTKQNDACGPVTYVNLDLPNIELDEASYAEKEGHARFIGPKDSAVPVDTLGTSYIRVSARQGAVETLDMRTVQATFSGKT